MSDDCVFYLLVCLLLVFGVVGYCVVCGMGCVFVVVDIV